MEGYRSYSEGRSPYSDGPYGETPQPEADYPQSPGWYGERPREAERYDERAPREPDRYDEPRRDLPRPSSGEPTRATAGAPRSVPPPAEEPPPPPPAPRRPPPVSPGSPGPVGDGVYRSKRPGTAALVGVPAVLLEIPALLLLRDAAFGDPVSPSGVVSAVCLILALPLLAVGLYAVATGAVRAAGPNSVQAWLRPPVAYLSVALALFIAAGFAG